MADDAYRSPGKGSVGVIGVPYQVPHSFLLACCCTQRSRFVRNNAVESTGSSCPLCRTAESVVLRNALAYARFDKYPVAPGHLLLIR